MAPAVTMNVSLTQSHSFTAYKADMFGLAKPMHASRRPATTAAVPAGSEQQQEGALLQPASSSTSWQNAEFGQLCNDGSAWTWSNFLVKLYRHTLGLLKQIYLMFMTLSLRTNHLMVRSSSLTLLDIRCCCAAKLYMLCK